MSWRFCILFAALPALAFGLMIHARGPSEEDDEPQRRQKAAAARDDVLRLADSLDRDEDEIEKQAGAIADKHNLESVMRVFKPRLQGDGVETTLLALEEKPLTRKELEARRDDLTRMAKTALAVSRATPLYVSRYATPEGPLTKAAWKRFSNDMTDRSQDLIEALKGDDGRAVGKAAWRLHETCKECHASKEPRTK